MQTIKTGVVVALLLAVCYGAFVALNAPEPELPAELQKWADGTEDIDDLLNIEMPVGDQLVSMDPSAIGSVNQLSGFAGKLPTDREVQQSPSFSDFELPTFDLEGRPIATGPAGSASTADSDLPVFPGSEPATGGGPGLKMPSGSGVHNAPDGLAVSLPAPSGASGLPQFNEVPKTQAQVVSTGGNASGLPVGEGDRSWQLPLLSEGGQNSANQSQPTVPFATARDQQLRKANEGKLAEALRTLSAYYNSPELTHAEHTDLVDILDALSREVIYSKRHLLTAAYVTEAKDSVASVAQKYNITPELLGKINQLGMAKALTPGTQLKVIQGPFRAQVSLTRGELTTFLGESYAGRFPISIGKDPVPVEGAFEVVDRRRDRAYYGTGGNFLAANDHRNPYGGYWLNLGQDLCIHGTPEMASTELKDAGCISLAPLDASDVYDILTQGSQVTIMH